MVPRSTQVQALRQRAIYMHADRLTKLPGLQEGPCSDHTWSPDHMRLKTATVNPRRDAVVPRTATYDAEKFNGDLLSGAGPWFHSASEFQGRLESRADQTRQQCALHRKRIAGWTWPRSSGYALTESTVRTGACWVSLTKLFCKGTPQVRRICSRLAFF